MKETIKELGCKNSGKVGKQLCPKCSDLCTYLETCVPYARF